MLPKGAEQIVEMRRKGTRPDELIIVSLVGRLPESNWVVCADGPDYDWRWARGLEVCIFGKQGTPNRQVALAVGQWSPKWLGMWDVETKQGADVHVTVREKSMDRHPLKATDWEAWIWRWLPSQDREFEGVG